MRSSQSEEGGGEPQLLQVADEEGGGVDNEGDDVVAAACAASSGAGAGREAACGGDECEAALLPAGGRWEDGEEEGDEVGDSRGAGGSSSNGNSEWHGRLHANLISDDAFEISCGRYGSVRVLDGPAAVKLFKFLAITWLGIIIWFYFVRYAGLENKTSLRLIDVMLYEGSSVFTDATFFFVVGRLYSSKARGVDHLAWIGAMVGANLYYAYSSTWKFLQHSFTLYEMHCRWPLQLWLYVALLVPLVVVVTLLHVNKAVQRGIFFSKLLELILTVSIFLLPPLLGSKYFHFHHWFAGWLIGMHCNFHDVWWSRLAMAWSWGMYVNGVATWGRDPLMTCGYALWMSAELRCPFLECYSWALEHENATSNNHTRPMVPPDWRNCSADSYHP